MNNIKRNGRIGSVAIAVCMLPVGMLACGVAPGGGGEEPNSIESPEQATGNLEAASATRPGADVTPPVLASAILANGNTVVFYDAKSGVLIAEQGSAYTPPITPEVTRAHVGDLPGTWKALLPTKSVPQALIDAQATMAQSQPSQLPPTGSANSSRATGTTGVLGKKTGPVANALYGCNNGCCDPDWLVNDMCWMGDWSWFYFNSPWSWTDSGDDTWTTRSLVCAAIGWSHLKIQVGGDNWAWWVPEGNYQSHAWYAGITWYGAWDSQHATSRVNMDSTDAKNTNTHCGQFNY